MNKSFPTICKSNFTGEGGVNLVSSIINNEFNWIFRINHSENDFGIDGYIDIVTEAGEVTGQSIAVQIKAGESFFKQKSPNGYTFYGEQKHLNYYSNHQLPVLIIICNLDSKRCYWEVFNLSKIEETTKNWKINILKKNTLGKDNKKNLISFLPQVVDVREELNQQTIINNHFKESDIVHYAISYEEIVNNDISNIKKFFHRLSVNDDLHRELQGKVEISVDGFNNDKREIYEIKEVRKWFQKANKKINCWFFFLNTNTIGIGFIIFFICNCISSARINNSKRMTGYEAVASIESNIELPTFQVVINTTNVSSLLEKNWLRLNEITDDLGMKEEENKVISMNIINALKSYGFFPPN